VGGEDRPPADSGDPDDEPRRDAAGDQTEDARGVTLDGAETGDFAAPDRTADDLKHPEETLSRPEQLPASFEDISRADLREHYGPIRTLFKRRGGHFRTFQHQLTQARERRTYDQYLAAAVARTAAILAAGIAVGVLAGVGLPAAARLGLLPRSIPGANVPITAVSGPIAGIAVLGGFVVAAGYFVWRRYVRIRRRIGARRREITYNLPYAMTFMYALAQAGVNFDRIVTRLADSGGTYGAVAEEFDRVVRDMEVFGNNLYTGLENLSAVTPSEELSRFADDVTSVLESGGDLAEFLRDEVDTQLEAAVDEQEAFIERLELLSEVFVVGFVAAPLFALVVLIVVSFLGADVIAAIELLVYVVIPLALVGFGVLIETISGPFTERAVSFSPGDEPTPPPTNVDDPEWRGAYERDRRLSGFRERLADQFARVEDEPWRLLLFSVPIGLAIPAVGVTVGSLRVGPAALIADPVPVTTVLVVIPVVVATAPVSVVHEYRRRRERAVERRFPALLKLLATSNRRGLSVSRALEIVAESTAGRLHTELRKLRNDIAWNADLPGAFEAFGGRLSSPRVTRSVTLIAEGSRATGDLHVVLGVAARDMAERVRLDRDRRQALASYLVIVIVGFLVYLLVVLLLAANFLDPIEAASAGAAAAGGGPVSLADIPVDRLRVVLFHSALIQGFGSGMLAGQLAENDLYSGLKYGIALLILAVVAFTVV